ncbi:MAG TPA: hypothetical protein VL947_09910 [Cytophagales bacterium]|nr:hypothetical protein [Cytophagales bacterium]
MNIIQAPLKSSIRRQVVPIYSVHTNQILFTPKLNYLCTLMKMSFEDWLIRESIPYDKPTKNSVYKSFITTNYHINNSIKVCYITYASPHVPSVAPLIFDTEDPDSIRIWEDQWEHKGEIIRSRIMAFLGVARTIHARKTTVRKITKPESSMFLNSNHMHGSTNAKIKYGLFYNDALVAVTTFTWPRKFYTESGIALSYGLSRHCSLNHFKVSGGLSKLMAHFIKNHSPDDIMTLVDLEWSTGASYNKLGFELLERTAPEVFYIEPNTLNRYLPYQLEDRSLDPQQLIQIQNRGNNKFKLILGNK